MIPLSPRLLCCASMIQGKYVCDIGTDHALLPIYLIKSNRCDHVIATDIREGPLAAAKAGLRRHQVEQSVELCLSDGLDKIPSKNITDVVIAGMGGETIRDILAAPAAAWLQRGTNLVLQPMTRAEVLRKWLAENGFTLRKETAVKDVHLYTVMQAQYTGECKAISDVEAYVGKLNLAEPLTKMYIATILERLHNKRNGIEQSETPVDTAEIQALIQGINQWMKK